jgi:hypothetical protein
MDAVDLVILVESPGTVARGLQRVGRAGHQVGAPSRAKVFPKHRGDLLEATVLVDLMHQGRIEETVIPDNPLDVLAQQVVAAVAAADHTAELLTWCGAPTRSATFPKACGMGSSTCWAGIPPTLPSCARGWSGTAPPTSCRRVAMPACSR